MTRKRRSTGRPRGRPANTKYHLHPVLTQKLDVKRLTEAVAHLAIYLDEKNREDASPLDTNKANSDTQEANNERSTP